MEIRSFNSIFFPERSGDEVLAFDHRLNPIHTQTTIFLFYKKAITSWPVCQYEISSSIFLTGGAPPYPKGMKIKLIEGANNIDKAFDFIVKNPIIYRLWLIPFELILYLPLSFRSLQQKEGWAEGLRIQQ